VSRMLPRALVLCLAAATLPAVAAPGPAPAPPVPDLARHVDPMVGTFAPGFTVPGAATPFGMTQVSPDTGGPFAYSGYLYTDPAINGFSHVHLSGPGVKKAGDIPFLPTTGPLVTSDFRAYGSTFDHATERAEAGYYTVRLDTYGVTAELTATTRTGIQRYAFPPAVQANVIVDAGRSVEGAHPGSFEVVDADTIRGWSRGRYPVYFESDFSQPFTSSGRWNAASGWVSFAPGSTVTVQTGISFVDAAGAKANLDAERTAFDAAKAAARAAWNRELARIQVTGGTVLDQRTFYTALYHSLLHPNVFEDADGRYLGFDGAVHDSPGRTHYANFSSWDTYKAQNQLLASVWPERYADMLRSLLVDATEGGKLPRWGEQNFDASHMSGDPAIPTITDGVCRGLLTDAEAEELYAEAVELVTRREAAWHQRGYLPLQASSRGAGTTLEYGVADFSLALLAHALGKSEDAATWAAQSAAYRDLLDPETRWIRPRNDDGSWHAPFDPTDETGFQEGNSWQYSWLAPHDARGVFDRMGGDAAAAERLDTHFSEAVGSVVPVAVAEAQTRVTAFGLVYRTNQYAPGNEHDLQTSWMYAHARQPWKVQSVQRQIQGVFRPTPEGLPGNDDLGSLSAWYVWSALGLGPVTPGAPFYVIGSPVFERAAIDLPGKKDVVINAPGASLLNKYVQSASIDRSWISHRDLRKAGTLTLHMGPTPNTTWGTASAPPSLSDSGLGAFACDR